MNLTKPFSILIAGLFLVTVPANAGHSGPCEDDQGWRYECQYNEDDDWVLYCTMLVNPGPINSANQVVIKLEPSSFYLVYRQSTDEVSFYGSKIIDDYPIHYGDHERAGYFLYSDDNGIPGLQIGRSENFVGIEAESVPGSDCPNGDRLLAGWSAPWPPDCFAGILLC